MRRKDFTPCACCGKGVMHTGLPLFWRVRVERMGIDARQVQQQHGLEQFFGGGPGAVALADVMGPGGPIATPFGDSATTILICEDCSTKSMDGIAILVDQKERSVSHG